MWVCMYVIVYVTLDTHDCSIILNSFVDAVSCNLLYNVEVPMT